MIGLLILLISIAMLLWGLWPLAIETRSLPISPSDMQLPQSGSTFLLYGLVI